MSPEKLSKTLAAILRDMEPCSAVDEMECWMATRLELSGDDQRTLQPDSVFLALVVLSNFRYWGCGEKVAWTIPVVFKGVKFALAHQKFGFRVQSPEPERVTEQLLQDLITCLRKAIRIGDKLIEPYAEEQIRRGNVTVENRLALFSQMYWFFRKKAGRAYRSKDRPLKVLKRDKNGKPVARGGEVFRPQREGCFLTAAMLDAYFSRLEHLLVLLLPFSSFDPDAENLREFIFSQWGKKFKRILDTANDLSAQRCYERLLGIKQTFRNPLFHGGFDKDARTLYFHVRGLGVVPVSLSQHHKSIHYGVVPIEVKSFGEICRVLDEADRSIESGRLLLAVQFVKAGLDVAFDKKSIATYRGAMSTEDSMEEFIGGIAQAQTNAANMDW
jgi:hypothetical protein